MNSLMSSVFKPGNYFIQMFLCNYCFLSAEGPLDGVFTDRFSTSMSHCNKTLSPLKRKSEILPVNKQNTKTTIHLTTNFNFMYTAH